MIVVDHFCGAGGESAGIMQAAEEIGLKIELHAHNHWARAIETHSANHPEAIHRQAAIENLNPVECVRGRRVGLMWASPECTHHSVARGGRPCEDQSRATAMHVIKWAQELYIDRIIVENVPEFLSWGPLGVDGRPLKSGRGKTFLAWCGMLKSLGYKVDWRLLMAADFGDPTTRTRLFVQAVRGGKKIVWPSVTHSEKPDMFGLKPWVAARDVIDFNIDSQSIFDRKRPLADATLRRIEHGIKKYWGQWAEPFLCVLRGTGTSRSVRAPLPAITAGGTHLALVEPFLTKFHGGRDGERRNYHLDDPLATLDCSNRFGVVEPLFIPQHSCGSVRPVSGPLSTVTTTGAISVVEPFIYASGHISSVRVQSIDAPLSTVVTKAENCLIEPLLVEYYGNCVVRPITEPLPTVTCKDRFGVLEGTWMLDIKFRMLQPSELAGAQGFSSDYWFSGTKADQIKQIGNAVCPGVARALAREIFAVG